MAHRDCLHAFEQAANRARIKSRSDPLLLLCRLAVEQALNDALQVDDAGKPTQIARDAFEWLTAQTNWTKRPGTPIPPVELRRGHVLSFEWCCEQLHFNPDEIRRSGLQRVSGLTHCYSGMRLPGVAGIRQHWQHARQQNERPQV